MMRGCLRSFSGPSLGARLLSPIRPNSSLKLRRAIRFRSDTSHDEESVSSTLLQGSRSLKPLLFAFALSISGYGAAAYYTNVDAIEWSKKVRTLPMTWNPLPPTTVQLMNARQLAVKEIYHGSATCGRVELLETKNLNMVFLATSDGKRTCYGITAINTLVFIAWQIPRLKPIMARHFTHHPLSGRSYTLLTSMFSHQSFMHLAFNSLALISFGAAFEVADAQRHDVTHLLHSTDRYHFLAFYIFAGLFSGALSHVVATRFTLPRILAALSDPKRALALTPAQTSIQASLGASGAIYGVVAMTSLALPEASVSLIFLPWIPIPITVGFAAMVGLDLVGIWRGWRMFDHWAHFGGAVAGTTYFYYSPWEYVRTALWPAAS